VTPDDVLKPLLERFQLPETVVSQLRLLLVREIEKPHSSHHTGSAGHYTSWLTHIFASLPPIRDFDGTAFSASIKELAHLSRDDYIKIYDTQTHFPEFRKDESWYKTYISEMEERIRDAKLENRSTTRLYHNLNELREGLRDLKPSSADGSPDEDSAFVKLCGSLWYDLLNFNVSFDIPQSTQFEHYYVLGSTGSGKTQLLQFLISQKLDSSVIVIDSQGDLIRNIVRLKAIDPERYVIIDPSDVEYPVALNIFDVGQDRVSKYSKLEYERHINGVIELLSYVFASILGAELTQRQGVALNFCLRLCLFIPNATIHTLRDIFSVNGLAPYTQYLKNLTESGQAFFRNEFDNPKAFGDVKSQVLRRLYGILENPTIERLFTHPKSRFDMKDAMDSGKVILINTAKDLLKQQGCSFFGRFFISLIAQATQERASQKYRKPTFVFIDEAQDYLDTNIATLLEQSRKYFVNITLAHQQLSQLPSEVQSSVITNTSTKFIGGCSSGDARTLAADMRADVDTLINQPKFHFTTFIRGFTRSAITLKIEAGYMERLPERSDEELNLLIANNRERVCSPALIPEQKKEDESTPDPGTAASSKW
jgi:hypothetical protein